MNVAYGQQWFKSVISVPFGAVALLAGRHPACRNGSSCPESFRFRNLTQFWVPLKRPVKSKIYVCMCAYVQVQSLCCLASVSCHRYVVHQMSSTFQARICSVYCEGLLITAMYLLYQGSCSLPYVC